MLVGATSAHAANAPVKQVPLSHFGWEVDGTTKANVCTVKSGDECQTGKESTSAGGFRYPTGVVAAPNGDLYIDDTKNSRVQELTAAGVFVLMFGKEVNATTKGDICTAASGNTCKAGVEGSLGGQLAGGAGIAVDQTTGNVFVQDASNWRVDEYTSVGAFVLTIGAEVDKVTKGNVCTAGSGDECGPGVENTSASSKPAAFNFDTNSGNLLAVGGPEDLLYVGDEHRVQEFDPVSGAWKGEISLAAVSSQSGSTVVALALDDSCVLHEPALTESTTPKCGEFDPEYGSLYLVYSVEGEKNVIRKFTPGGVEVNDGHFPLMLSAQQPGGKVNILGLASDPANRIAEVGFELSAGTGGRIFGTLHDGRTGRFLTELFVGPIEALGLAFGRNDDLYAALPVAQEVTVYKPVPVAELLTSSAPCSPAGEVESDVTFSCGLTGEVDPWGIKEAEAWFEWGKTPQLGARTPAQPVEAKGVEGEEELPLAKVGAPITGLLPDATYYYRVAAFDQNVKPPETSLSSDTASFTTGFVAPKVVGEPRASFVKSSSGVLFGQVNPENARTEYFFEYAEGPLGAVCANGVRSKEACPDVLVTPVVESGAYGKTGVTQEAAGLRPGTLYHYRLFAESENAGKTGKLASIGAEATFTTASGVTVEALTGGTGSITTTSALVSGSVNPGGQPASYAFELGVYAGAATQYGTVFSGPVAAGAAVEESLALTGLQPGTTYAYRVRISSGYGTAYGAAATFTTAGLPSVLVLPTPLAMLAVPSIAFPVEAKASEPPKAKKAKKPKKRAHKQGKTHKRKPRKGKK